MKTLKNAVILIKKAHFCCPLEKRKKEKRSKKEIKEKDLLSYSLVSARAHARKGEKIVKIFDFLPKFIICLQNVITFVNTWEKIGGIITA